MGKWCLHASLFIFDWIIIKVAGNQDRHKSLVEFDFGPNQTTHFGVTCPWVKKISHFWTLISLKPVGKSWSNFMCSIVGVRERLHKVWRLGLNLAHWTQVNDRCPLGYLFFIWVAPVAEWLRTLIFSTLNSSSSHRCGLELCSGHMCDEPSSACGWSGVFLGDLMFSPNDLAQNEWNNLDGP